MNIFVFLLTCLGIAGSIGLTYALAEPTRARVIRLLKKHEIDYHAWGTDSHSNTLDTLIECIESGEVWLESHPDKILIQHIHVAVVTVTCTHGGRELVLREFRNGARRPFSGSLGEKIKSEESSDPICAARRGLVEELGPTEPRFRDPSMYTLTPTGCEVSEPRSSDFYGEKVFDVYHRLFFSCVIDPALYHTMYTAQDKGRHICFKWSPIDEK